MEVSPIGVALIGIVERRNAAIAERDTYRSAGLDEAWHNACGEILGLQKALEILQEAGLPVASAEYLARTHKAD